MQKYWKCGETPVYELDHESKMRILKTHSHSSNGFTIEPGKREEDQLKETQTLQQGEPPIKNLSHAAGVAGGWVGGGGKRLYGKQTTGRHYDKANLVGRKGNTSAKPREKSCPKPPPNHWHGGG